MEDYFKSIKSVLYDRISSPFYGTLIISWLIWNWKIPYVTFFVSEKYIGYSKIDFITNCLNVSHSITYPILSAAVLILIMPFLTNGAFWISHKFDIWRNNKRNELDKNVLLTLEQSLDLRNQIDHLKLEFAKIVNTKEEDIKLEKQKYDILSISLTKKDEEIDILKSDKNKLEQDISYNVEVITNQNYELTSLRKQKRFDIIFIDEFLNGVWINHHKYPNGIEDTENLEIRNGNEYYVNNILEFKLEFIEFNLTKEIKEILFEKVSQKEPNKILKNKLTIINENKLIGLEGDNIQIEYTRQIDGKSVFL